MYALYPGAHFEYMVDDLVPSPSGKATQRAEENSRVRYLVIDVIYMMHVQNLSRPSFPRHSCISRCVILIASACFVDALGAWIFCISTVPKRRMLLLHVYQWIAVYTGIPLYDWNSTVSILAIRY